MKEAVMKVLGMDYKRCSRRTKFVPTGPADDRWRFLKKQAVLDLLGEDDENVFVEGLVEYYQGRDQSQAAVKNMSLIIFAAFYDKQAVRKTEIAIELEEMGEEEVVQQEIELEGAAEDAGEDLPAEPVADKDPLNPANLPATVVVFNKSGRKTATFTRRKRRAIIRYFRFSPQDEPEKYFLSMLQLFWPFTSEEADLDPKKYGLTTVQELFDSKKGDLRMSTVMEKFEFFSDLLAEAYIKLAEQRGGADLDRVGGIHALEEGYGEEGELDMDPGQVEAVFGEGEGGGAGDGVGGDREVPFKGQPPPATDAEDLTKRLDFFKKNFNNDQWAAFTAAERTMDEYIRCKLSYTPFEGMNHFIHGSGGTGKSFMLESIRLMVHEKVVKSLGASLGNSTTVVTAPTGCAALNVNGSTIHRAFNLIVQQGKRKVDTGLKGPKLQRLQTTYADLHAVFIDEVHLPLFPSPFNKWPISDQHGGG